jgi:hypothetical protein
MRMNTMDMHEYFGQLVGFTITKYYLSDYDPDDFESFPRYQMKHERTNEVIDVEVSRDPEGNGGGFLFIAPSIEN